MVQALVILVVMALVFGGVLWALAEPEVHWSIEDRVLARTSDYVLILKAGKASRQLHFKEESHMRKFAKHWGAEVEFHRIDATEHGIEWVRI